MAQTVAKCGINKVVLFFLHIAADRAGGAVVGLIDLRHFAAIDMRQLVPGAASTADLDMLIRVSGRIKGMRKSLLIAALGAGAFMSFVMAQIRADDVVLVIRKPTAVGAGMRVPLRRI